MRSGSLARAIDAAQVESPLLRRTPAPTVIDLRDRNETVAIAPSDPIGYLDAVVSSPPRLPRISRRLPIRVLDIVGAGVGLLVLAPAFLTLALLVRLSSPGPIFFRQERVGRQGSLFSCAKFRTMHVDADERLALLLRNPSIRSEWVANQKIRNDPRITRVGRHLRHFDLDELPQLWNVLKGEMSLVGPRPVLVDEAERYGDRLAAVLTVRPGMTGLWQVSGRNELAYETRVEIDACYVAVHSVAVNLALILRTFWLIIVRRNGAV